MCQCRQPGIQLAPEKFGQISADREVIPIRFSKCLTFHRIFGCHHDRQWLSEGKVFFLVGMMIRKVVLHWLQPQFDQRLIKTLRIANASNSVNARGRRSEEHTSELQSRENL